MRVNRISEFVIKAMLNVEGSFMAVFTALCLTFFYGKYHHATDLQTFKGGVISSATLASISIGARVDLFYKYSIIVIVGFFVCTIGYFSLTSIVRSYVGKSFMAASERRLLTLSAVFGTASLISVLFGITNYGELKFLFFIPFTIILHSLLRTFALRLEWLRKPLNLLVGSTISIWTYTFSFSMMILWIYLGKVIHLSVIQHTEVAYFLGLLTGDLIAVFTIEILYSHNLSTPKIRYQLPRITLPIFLLPIWLVISNEAYLALSEHFIFVSPKVIFLVALGISVLIVFRLIFSRRNFIPQASTLHYIRKVYYPILILMVSFFAFRPAMSSGPPNELFESGNPGVAIEQLFKFGKIPLLQTFNAHGISELFSPMIYVLLNGFHGWDMQIYTPLITGLVYMYVCYFVLRKVLGSEISILCILFLSSIQLLVSSYFIFGLIPVLCLGFLFKKEALWRYFIVWLTIACEILWRYDIGFAAAITTLIILVGRSLITKSPRRLWRSISTALIVSAACVALFLLIAVVIHVPISYRLPEMLDVFTSNQAWGYATLGDSSKSSFSFYYYAVPAICFISLLELISLRYLSFKSSIRNIKLVTVYASLFTLINYPRGIVRHSLVETSIVVSGFFGLILLMQVLLFKTGKRNLKTISLLVLVSSSYVILSGNRFMWGTELSPAFVEKAFNQIISFHNYSFTKNPVKRYVVPEDYLKGTYSDIMQVFNKTLTPQQTFIDFSDSPYLYVLTGRLTPMYVNQTPAFLSDDITQDAFLHEIGNYSEPYVVFPDTKGWTSLDGVSEELRAYRVSEYIYTHYIPFISTDGFNLWVRRDLKGRFSEMLSKISNVNYTSLPSYVPIETFDLQWLPFIWGESNKSYQSDHIPLKEVIMSDQSEMFALPKTIDKSRGNFIFVHCKANSDISNAYIKIYYGNMHTNKDSSRFKPSGSFSFFVKEDGKQHDYLVRISSQYAWYSTNPTDIEIVQAGDVAIGRVSIS